MTLFFKVRGNHESQTNPQLIIHMMLGTVDVLATVFDELDV